MIVASVIIRLTLSVIFFRAALHKWRDHTGFQSGLSAYRLLPEFLLPGVTPVLIATEAGTALMLLNLSSGAGALLAIALLLVYGWAMAINLLKGRDNIDCGCNGPNTATKTISWKLVLRNAVLASLAILPATIGIPTLTTGNSALALVATACALLLYEACEQALANSQRYRHWLARQPVKP